MTDKTTTNHKPQDYGEPWEASVYNDEDQEPWDYDDIRNRDGRFILHVSYDEPTRTRDRIIACVNACAGLSNDELKNPLIRVGVLRNALQALGREQKAREKPGLDEELMEKPVEPGFCSISIDAKDMSKHVKAGALYKIVEALAKEWNRGSHFSELGEEAHHLINEIYWMDRKKR